MKKLKLNCPLQHKANSHDTVQVEVEKVITLYGSRFQQMRDHPLEDCPEITQHRDLMYMAEGVAHCLLFVDTRFVSLSTCSYEFKDARTVLTGTLTEMGGV